MTKDPHRPSAYKNLGIALQNKGKYAEAAEKYLHATELYPTDRITPVHLQDLVANHTEILEERPDLLELLDEYQEASPDDVKPRLQ
jgi:tetratricopeptide (TPR) repeat protein